MGTLHYSAREQMLDASNVDERVDVFGLGMVGVFLIGGNESAIRIYFEPEEARKLDSAHKALQLK